METLYIPMGKKWNSDPYLTKKIISQWINGDFPGGLAVKSLSASVGDTGSIPGPGNKITHAAEHWSPCTITTEPPSSGAHVPQKEKSLHQEAHGSQLESSRHLLKWGNTQVQQRRPNAAKNNQTNE